MSSPLVRCAKWAGMLLALPLVLVGTALSTGAQAGDLVVASWGDPMYAGWRKSLIPKFEEKFNAKVIWTEGFSSQTLGKLKAQEKKPEIDVALFDDGPFYQAVTLGLCQKVDYSKIPNVKDLFPSARVEGEMGVNFGIVGVGLWYNTEVFERKGWAAPTSWLDVFDPKFKKRISGHTIANGNGVATLLAINDILGGTLPTDMEPGFKKLKEYAEIVVTFDQFGETPTLIQQGTTVMGIWSNDRIWNLSRIGGIPIQLVYPKEGFYGWREAACIPKGRPAESVELAHIFLDMLLSKEEQENTAKYNGFIPLHPDVKGYGTEEEVRNVKWIPWATVNPYRAQWTERWAKEVERKKQ
jgi:putative spermidine/putrescine transport system substrate-binding protein